MLLDARLGGREQVGDPDGDRDDDVVRLPAHPTAAASTGIFAVGPRLGRHRECSTGKNVKRIGERDV